MKYTLGTTEAALMLAKDEYAGFSYHGAVALVEYLEDSEDDFGEELEFDPIGIRCTYTEYDSPYDAAKELLDSDTMDYIQSEFESATINMSAKGDVILNKLCLLELQSQTMTIDVQNGHIIVHEF